MTACLQIDPAVGGVVSELVFCEVERSFRRAAALAERRAEIDPDNSEFASLGDEIEALEAFALFQPVASPTGLLYLLGLAAQNLERLEDDCIHDYGARQCRAMRRSLGAVAEHLIRSGIVPNAYLKSLLPL